MANGINDLAGWVEDFHAQRSRNPGYFQPSSETPSYYAPRIMSESSHLPMPSAGTQYSSASSAGTQCSSMFDDVYTHSSMSTSPPDDAPPHHYQHQPVLGPGPSRLLCEWVEYGHCGATFNVNDEEGWISHIVQSHLGNNFPTHCVCWFCDGEFIAQSNSAADCWVSYQARMYHIADHFRTQGLRANQMRPDHFFLDHIHRHGLIRDEEYRYAINSHELEQIPGLHEAGWRPTRNDPSNRVVETNRRHRRRGHRSSRHS
ncbi:hypothetical protein BKA56DRAFT_206951 [Ilyonectria sp. MPI-CAGE-AT-0026]|nr:hypothetical protein BKA56DRAFT_206951 [Ilyonectria sp. MPI-CAGE-AT-0026]